MNDNKYNGYTNYETWAVNLWLDNEAMIYGYWLNLAEELLADNESDAIYNLSQAIKDDVTENMPLADNPSLYSDLLQSALSAVNWQEVAEGFVLTAKEEAVS